MLPLFTWWIRKQFLNRNLLEWPHTEHKFLTFIRQSSFGDDSRTFSGFKSPNEPQSDNHHDPESSSCLTLDSSSVLTDLKFSSWWLPELPASLRVHLSASEQVKKNQKIPQSSLAEGVCPLNVMLYSCEDTWSSPHKKVTEICMSLRQAHHHLKSFFYLFYFWLHLVFVAVCGLSLVVASNRLLSSWGMHASHCDGFTYSIT